MGGQHGRVFDSPTIKKLFVESIFGSREGSGLIGAKFLNRCQDGALQILTIESSVGLKYIIFY
jgi:hypothetical protein